MIWLTEKGQIREANLPPVFNKDSFILPFLQTYIEESYYFGTPIRPVFCSSCSICARDLLIVTI